MRMRVLGFVAIVALIFVAGHATTSAGCPNRPPGYWVWQRCTGTTIMVNGAPCLVEICYCMHFGNPAVPGDIDEMSIYSIRGMMPGCPGPTPDPNTVAAAMEQLVFLNCRGDLEGEGHPCSGEKDIKVTHALCFHNVGQGANIFWFECSNSGECSITYRVRCADCVIEKQIDSSISGSCDNFTPGNEDCVIVCQ